MSRTKRIRLQLTTSKSQPSSIHDNEVEAESGINQEHVPWLTLPYGPLVRIFELLSEDTEGKHWLRIGGSTCKLWKEAALDVLMGDDAASRPRRFLVPVDQQPARSGTTCAATVSEPSAGEKGVEACSKRRKLTHSESEWPPADAPSRRHTAAAAANQQPRQQPRWRAAQQRLPPPAAAGYLAQVSQALWRYQQQIWQPPAAQRAPSGPGIAALVAAAAAAAAANLPAGWRTDHAAQRQRVGRAGPSSSRPAAARAARRHPQPPAASEEQPGSSQQAVSGSRQRRRRRGSEVSAGSEGTSPSVVHKQQQQEEEEGAAAAAAAADVPQAAHQGRSSSSWGFGSVQGMLRSFFGGSR